MMVFVSHLIATFKKDHMNYFEYETQVAKIMGLLDEWDADEDLKKKTLDYYSVFWQKRSGLRDMPEMFNVLPTALKKEVTVDIFWEALRHSHFFGGTGMSFKRSVSLVMKSEFLLPGDFLFRIDELKTKMVYIVSGVVQILSSEDDDSPIMSFSSGTLLGETGCLIATSSPANLRTATYCEIQALYLTDLYKVLLNFPVIAKYIKQQLSNRISTAKHDLAKHKNSDDLTKETTIKAVREFWNEIWRSSTKKGNSKVHVFTDRIRAENLDLLALSDEVELRVDSICLSGHCPFVLDPDTIFRRFCDIVVVFAVLVQIFLIPQAAFFYNRMTDGEMSILFLMDVIYLFDIYLQISTAVKSNDGLISDVRKILVIRMKQINFLVDVVATIPFDYIAMCIDTSVICIIKYIFMYVCSIYWLTCVMSGVSNLDKTNTSWFNYNVELYNLSISTYYKFHASLLMNVAAYMNYGPTGFDVYSFYDTWFYFFIVVCGHLLFSYGFSELTAGVVLKHDDERTNRTYLYTLKREASQYKIASEVHSKVLRFLNFHYTVRAGCQIFGEEGIFENAPMELRNEIVRHRIIHCLKKVPLFADASDDLLRYIVAHSEMKLVPPNSVILKAENKSDLLYVLMRGYCMMQSSLPGDLERGATAVLQIGSTFPFLETFHGAFSFLSVTTITVAELLLIRTDIIMNAFQTYEADYGSFRDALKEHKQVYGSILFRKGARLPLLTSVEKAKKKGRVFEYDVHDIDDVQYNERAYRQPFLRLGAWSFLRFVLLRKTINPDSWFYVCWEVLRCIVAVVYAFCGITMSTLIGHTMELWGKFALFMTLNFYCWIDLYVRMHCQFYNKKGILVTHPLTTARHYIRTSFTVDLISAVPIRSFKLDQLLGSRHQTFVMICGMLFTKLLHLHRPWSGLSYLEKKYKGKKGLAVHMIKYLLVIIMAIAFCQTLAMLVLCNAYNERLYCEKRQAKRKYPYTKYFIEYFYKVSTFFTISTTGTIPATFKQGVLFVILLLPMYILRWIFMITTTSKAIGGNVELTLYRDRMKSYMEFLEGAFVNEKDIQAIVAHYEYVWKKSQGMNMHHVLKYFHPQLEQDMAYSLYSNTLLRATLFQGEHPSVFEALTPLFYREYYTKDSKIIQCNDIQTKIFFVHEGSVDIYIANTPVCILESGGMFGCLQKTGITRQTLTAVTKVHSTVLTVDSTLLHRTLQSFPKVYERLSRLILLNYEYLKETKESAEGVASQKLEIISQGLYDQYKPFFDKIYIMEDGVGYSALNYLVCVHIYPLGANFILGATFINLHNQHPQWGQKLSPSLYSKVSNYCLRLWQCQRGDWLPEMIQESPSSLKENIMNGLYGKNLTNHFLFQATHKDFLRQLVVHLERFVFSPGDSIVEKGDSDCCMYFISSGEVNVYEVEGKTEVKMLQLSSGMSFGEAQGLYCISHHYSYRACTVCDILILNKNRWEYLLKWFPASREEIYAKAQSNGLHRAIDEMEIL
ncbi:cyclic nucleotide-gated cation channel subunit a [Holotrichia oblita]|uniref:Cyclic nucleotide-gated cation channel subunit a n=1 Tax=Holotrichia oblita TaxID=644536 RepID=A0ACB9SL46_HOLOL|nr:cyclic nucleotide-gated cation channel subunit a [Holotrichia oblita]